MNLRPHHALCIQKFTGHGYDETFTKHMTALVLTLTVRQETPIVITQGCDDLCLVCPNNRNGACISLEKVDYLDSSVLAAYELTYGETVPWAEFAHRARERIFDTDEFYHICNCCQWFELCRDTEVSYGENEKSF